jgi:hypothetical protein
VVVTPAFAAGRSVRFDLPLLAAELFAVAFGAVVFAIISLLLTFEDGRGQEHKQKRPSSCPLTHRGLTRSSSYIVAYAAPGIGKESTIAPAGRQGGLRWSSVWFYRPVAASLLPPGTAEQGEDHARQDERAPKGRRLHDVRMHVVMSESAHNPRQYSTAV